MFRATIYHGLYVTQKIVSSGTLMNASRTLYNHYTIPSTSSYIKQPILNNTTIYSYRHLSVVPKHAKTIQWLNARPTIRSYTVSNKHCISVDRSCRNFPLRQLSSSTSNNNKQQQSSSNTTKNTNQSSGDPNSTTTTSNEIVLTPGETVVAVSRLSFYAAIALFASACAYYIAMELIPTKMSPNRIFDRSLDIVRKHPDIIRRYGDTIKGYGRDHGGHREGRRNFIEHTEYVNEDDQSKRVRVRYNIEGRFGYAFVFVEVSSKQPSGEFVYILVQDKANGHTQTIIDNRAAMTAQRLMGDNKEAGSAISQLLTGGSNNDKK